MEIIPRAKGFVVRLAADAADLLELTPEVQEAAAWTFIINSTVAGGSLYVVASPEQVETACALVERTYRLMFE
ncbi:MAG TPA: hypothetical protein VIM34_15255 [Burkholderiaceae bacterium]